MTFMSGMIRPVFWSDYQIITIRLRRVNMIVEYVIRIF